MVDVLVSVVDDPDVEFTPRMEGWSKDESRWVEGGEHAELAAYAQVHGIVWLGPPLHLSDPPAEAIHRAAMETGDMGDES